MPGEELTLDYSWDKNILQISEDVPCLCGSEKCRGFLMRAKKSKKEKNSPAKLGNLVTSSKLEEETAIKKMASESIPLPARVVKEVPFSPLSAAIPLKNRKAANLVAIEVADRASCSPASLHSEEKNSEIEDEPMEDGDDQNEEQEEDLAQEEDAEEEVEEEEDEEVGNQLEKEVNDDQLEDQLELKMGYEVENEE